MDGRWIEEKSNGNRSKNPDDGFRKKEEIINRQK